MPSEYVEITPGLVVYKYNILTTDTWVAELLQTAPRMEGFSSTFTPHVDAGLAVGGTYGEYSSATIPLEIDALRPMSRERADAYFAWKTAREEEAYTAIVATFPEFANGRRSMGLIETELG